MKDTTQLSSVLSADNVAVVTGAASGIGLAAARRGAQSATFAH
jgi:NAD(P)-dependent dehydrogenase (short-subunit alcohol dehydrogenase family)